jgi:hypothetical protein
MPDARLLSTRETGKPAHFLFPLPLHAAAVVLVVRSLVGSYSRSCSIAAATNYEFIYALFDGMAIATRGGDAWRPGARQVIGFALMELPWFVAFDL